MKEHISKMIACRRKALRMTQEQLGEKLCVSGQAVSKWECGVSQT
ncbi:MAG: helix-turn-helix transcriptional regulator [Clostridia bacterium]|nr:helix-turn-helix transcriptional regulator [Clostridia bacterium]